MTWRSSSSGVSRTAAKAAPYRPWKIADPERLSMAETCARLQPEPIAFRTIDHGASPEMPIANAHPIPVPSIMTGPVDGRRRKAWRLRFSLPDTLFGLLPRDIPSRIASRIRPLLQLRARRPRNRCAPGAARGWSDLPGQRRVWAIFDVG